MMSCLWLCLSLCAATFLQSSVWSHEVLCNKTVNVVAAQTVTLNCTIDTKNCRGVRYYWNNTQGDIQCSNSLKYRCEWDRLTYVSLTITNVTEEENYTIHIQTECGVTKPSTMKVQVKSSNITDEDETKIMPILLPILGIVIALALIALGVLYLTRKRLQKTTLTKDTGQRNGDPLIA